MRYDPKASDSAGGFRPLEPGFYDAELIASDEKTFSSGSKGFCFQWKIWAEGETRHLYDNVVLVNKHGETVSFAAHKLKELCNAIGKLDRYESGDMNEMDFAVGLTISLDLDVEDNEYKGKVTKKNSVVGYRGSDAVSTPPPPASKAAPLPPEDDEIPF